MRRGQVIFVGADDKKRIPALLATLKDAPVLTVGDTENFAQNGGMIGLFLGTARSDLKSIWVPWNTRS